MTGTDPMTSSLDNEKRIEPTVRPLNLSGRAMGLVQAGQAKLINLPGGHQWALRRIEKSLLANDKYLESQFTIFWRSTRLDAMPLSERMPAGPWQRRAVLLTAAGLSLLAVRSVRVHSGGAQTGIERS